MQTFLPYKDFSKCAKVLDTKRLGKQRVETWQILRALLGFTKGWVNHPATQMWKNDRQSLVLYGLVMCEEWIKRGYKDSLFNRFMLQYDPQQGTPPIPSWITDDLCQSHQSNLIRKLSSHYVQYFGNIPSDLPYVWPTKLIPTTNTIIDTMQTKITSGKRYDKPRSEKIMKLTKDMISDTLAEAFKYVTGHEMPNTTEGSIATQMKDAIDAMDEKKQKEVMSKFREMLKG
jgi:hypothetical protein